MNHETMRRALSIDRAMTRVMRLYVWQGRLTRAQYDHAMDRLWKCAVADPDLESALDELINERMHRARIARGLLPKWAEVGTTKEARHETR